MARLLGANVAPEDLYAPQKIAGSGQTYVQTYAVCYFGPGVRPTQITQGVNATPSDLFRAEREPDPQENFQFIKHDIKMTGAAAVGPTRTDDQVWALVTFLNVLPGISAADLTSAIESSRASLSIQPEWNGG